MGIIRFILVKRGFILELMFELGKSQPFLSNFVTVYSVIPTKIPISLPDCEIEVLIYEAVKRFSSIRANEWHCSCFLTEIVCEDQLSNPTLAGVISILTTQLLK